MSLRFKLDDRELTMAAKPGATLLELAAEAGIAIESRCGGRGGCGSCTVILEEGRFSVFDRAIEIEYGHRREAPACKTRVLQTPATVYIPPVSMIESRQAAIETDLALPPASPGENYRRVDLRLPAADLQDPLPDRRRLCRALEDAGLRNVYCPPSAFAGRPPFKSGDGEAVTVELLHDVERYRVLHIHDVPPRTVSYGVALDIGTTTVVAALVDMTSGRIIDRAARYNQQILRADDVAARIALCSEPKLIIDMQRLLVEHTINPLLDELRRRRELERDAIVRLAAAGNTVMVHLLLGITPEGIGRLPFQPLDLEFETLSAEALGLAMHPAGLVDLAPAIAGYIGGDVTADIHATSLIDRPGTNMLIDMGTNGEIVLSGDGCLLACATAAGPAFEGAGLLHGCRAARGAINSVRLNADKSPELKVIGNSRPIGLCGTAAIEFMAEARSGGLINRFGRFDEEMLDGSGRLTRIPLRKGPSLAYRLHQSTSHEVAISEFDMAQVLKAKAAIYAGIKTLLAEADCPPSRLNRVILAGGFARRLDIERTIILGLLPELPPDRFEAIGNGSLAGAWSLLVDKTARGKMAALARRPRVIQLNLTRWFADRFQQALAIPYLEPGEFPRVERRISS